MHIGQCHPGMTCFYMYNVHCTLYTYIYVLPTTAYFHLFSIIRFNLNSQMVCSSSKQFVFVVLEEMRIQGHFDIELFYNGFFTTAKLRFLASADLIIGNIWLTGARGRLAEDKSAADNSDKGSAG